MALTRKDGYAGQNILELVMNAENIDEVKNLAYQKIKSGNGCIKCEILCSTANFEELKKVAGYSNRRSAVSGIVSTPSNIKYAKYLTIMPLLYKDGDEFIYAPEDSEIVYDDISVTDAARLYLMADAAVFSGTSITWYYAVDGSTNFKAITPLFFIIIQ